MFRYVQNCSDNYVQNYIFGAPLTASGQPTWRLGSYGSSADIELSSPCKLVSVRYLCLS